MKKSLIALAVLAASGAAMAQSSVTLYGIVDAYVGSLKSGISTNTAAANINAVSQTGVNSGGLNTNRWGLKGSEDLGGGLKANFQLEQGFAVDSGAGNGFTATTSNQFDRQAWVGLSGGFGEVKFGRTWTAYDLFRGAVNHTANLNTAVTGNVFAAAGGDYTSNQGNQIQYATPVFSGVSAAVGYSFGENKNGTGNVGFGSTDTLSLHVKYGAGPLVVGYAYQSEEQLAGAEDTDYNFVGASYDFGVAKLVGGYNRTTRAGDSKDSEYQLGVSAPFGPTTVYFGYASAKTKVAGVTTEKASGYSLTASYALSKRTDVYAAVKSATEKNGAGAKQGDFRQVALGLRHVF